jgi:thiol-disulfide isomerase/thioredoxin
LSFKSIRPALRRRTILGTTAALAAAAAGGNFLAQAQARDDDDSLPDAADNIQQNQPYDAPNLHFTDAAGRKLSLGDFRGSGLIVNLWATWCGPCVAEFPTLAAVAPKLLPEKILVLPISIDFEGAKAVKPFYTAHDIQTLPILLDPNGTTTDALNTAGVPFTIIVTPSGQIAAHSIGAGNWNTSRTIAMITQLAAPRPSATSPIQPV